VLDGQGVGQNGVHPNLVGRQDGFELVRVWNELAKEVEHEALHLHGKLFGHHSEFDQHLHWQETHHHAHHLETGQEIDVVVGC